MPADDDDIIDSAVVRIGPDLRGFRTKLKKDLAEALKGVEGSVKIKLVADKTGFATSMREQLKQVRRQQFKVDLVADTKGFAASVKKAVASAGSITQQINHETTADHKRGLNEQTSNQQQASARQTRIMAQQAREADRISRRQAAEQKKRFKDLRTGPPLIDYGGKGIRPTNLLLGTVVAMTPALFAMASSAVQASTSIAALGSASIGAAFAIGGLAVAFQGIGDALNLRKSVQDEALTAAANAKDATDDLARARRNLADAQRDEKTANAAVHEQRREAIRDLADLKRAVIDLNNQYKADSLSVDEAKEAESATHRNFFATALERRRATQDRLDAQTRLGDTALERKQKTEDLKTSLKKGIEGSDKVRDAKERARDARDRTLDAQDSVRTQQKNVGGISKTSSAAAQLKKKLAEMAPAARDIYYWFDKNEQTFKRLQRQIAQDVLPGFYKFLTAINTKVDGKTSLELAAKYAGELGAIVSKYAGVFGEWTKSDFFRERMGRIQETNAKAFDTLGRALTILAKPLLRIIDRAAPGFEILANSVERFAMWFDKVIEKADKDGSLAKWFEDARVSARKWFDLAGNIIGIVGNLFKVSLPAGGSLLDQFREFTQSIEDWTGSPQGQRSIKDFFDTIAGLPFAKIADFFVNATAFFVAFRTLRFLATLNPFFTAFAAFSVANPAGAAKFFEIMGKGIGFAVDQLAAHPEAAATLLGIMAAAKFAKAVGFDIKIPVVTSLRDALVSRFKVLDKFVGGGAQTATMNVQAGVVNVYGGAGLPGGAKPGKAGKAGAAGTAAAAGGGLLVAGVTIAAVAGALFATDGFKRGVRDEGLLKPFQEFTDDPSWKTFASTLKLLSPAHVAGYAVGKLRKTAQDDEKQAFKNAQYKAVLSAGRLANDPSVVRSEAVTKYTDARKKSVAALVEETKATKGQAAADAVALGETKKSATTLSNLLQLYGYSKQKADAYANATSGLNEMLYKNRMANLAAGIELDKTGAKADNAARKFGILGEKLSEITGEKLITLTIKGEEKVFKDLTSAVAYQQVLRMGVSPTESKVAQLKQQIVKNMADGGRVPGFSPNKRADNIPAMLTADEYVQPVDAVRHYGTDFMDAIRTRSLPKYAAGGRVAAWPFAMKMPDALAAIQPAYSPAGGTASGNFDVAETAEATARAMGASEKQLVALIEAGLVESGLRNINYGDRDSVGFLQQRAGWGSLKARMDVATATRKFINKARRVDNSKYTAGQLAQAVQVSAFPDRYDQRQADAIAVINRALPYMSGYEPPTSSGTSGGGSSSKTGLIAFGRWLQSMGYSVSEHPAFGGVAGVHVKNSQHYRAQAIDVNRGAGTSAKEQAYLRQIIPEAHRRGFRSIFMAPGHYNHAHFDLGQGKADGGKVRRYDSGGQLPPGYTLAFNGTGKNETIRTAEQEKSLNAPMRIDRRDLAQLAALFGGGTSAVNMDGRKVAELTNRYNYLPAGV